MLLNYYRNTLHFYEFFVFLFVLTPIYSQQSNVSFTHYTTRDGLSTNITTALFQDSRGLLWIGSVNGLNFFDGVSFQNIFPSDFDTAYLHSDHVYQIAENGDGNVLILTADGLEEYYWKTKRLHLIFPLSMDGGIANFIIDKQKNIWLLDKKYLRQYNQQFKLLNSIVLDSQEKEFAKGPFINTFYFTDKANNIWFNRNGILCEWNIATHVLENRFHNIYNKKVFEISVSDMIQDAKGNFWIIIDRPGGINNPLVCYYPESNSLKTNYFKNNFPFVNLILSNSGKLWITSNYKGLVIYDTMSKILHVIHHKEIDSNSPSDNYFRQLFEDRDGNIWLSSDYGLDKYSDLSNNFTLLNNYGYVDSLTHYYKPVVNDVLIYKKNLFVCTSAGFFKINMGNLDQEHFRFDEKEDVLQDNYWISFFIKKNLLLTSTWKGIFFYNVNERKLHPLLLNMKHPALFDSVPIVASFEDNKRNLWLGMLGNNGIYCWDKTNNTFIKYDREQTGNFHFPLRHFTCAAEDDSGNIWMGYDKGGIAIFDAVLRKFFQPVSSVFSRLSENAIHAIINDHHGNLWFSTSRGLLCYSLLSHNINQYTRRDGLISNIIIGMVMDKDGIFWLGTYCGLSRFDPLKKEFTNFTNADGLPDESIDEVVYDSAIDKICFTTRHNVVLFDPYSLKKNTSALSPVITSFSVLGEERNIDNSPKINLTYIENFFSFRYTASDLQNASDVEYAYKLEGFNKDWVKTGKGQYAGFTNLPGGDYKFKVKASIDGINWFYMRDAVPIHIETPFYKTTSFYLIVVFGGIVIIFLIFYSAYLAQLKRILLAQKIRHDIAADLHDDIGSSLSSIMLMSDLAKKRQEETSNYFDKIKQNASNVIENMNDIVWSVNPENDTIEQMFIRMQNYASSLLEKKDIKFLFLATDSLKSIKFTMEERKNFYLTFKEAIHNAFKYSGCKEVTVKIDRQNKGVLMIIMDDGKGFNSLEKHIGNGLNNMKQRTGQIKGNLEIISSPGKGTTLTLFFKPTQKGS